MKDPFTVFRLPFTVRYPFSVYHDEGVKAQAKGGVKGEEQKVKGFTGGKS